MIGILFGQQSVEVLVVFVFLRQDNPGTDLLGLTIGVDVFPVAFSARVVPRSVFEFGSVSPVYER